MNVTVGTLKKMLGDFPDERLVYVVNEDGLEFPKLTDAYMDPEIEKELPKDVRLGKFVLITAQN